MMDSPKMTAQKDPKNGNCFNIYLNGRYYTNVGAETEASALQLGREILQEANKESRLID